MGRAFAVGTLLLVTTLGCHTITEELPPAQNVTAPTPIIVNPPPGNSVLIIPGPSPSPQPQQSPSPHPSPSATPNPSQGNQNPPESVFVSVTSFLRNGQLVKGRASSYKPGDVIYLTCTPKDGSGTPTKNHGPIQDWRIRSGNLGGSDYNCTDQDTFNPDCHISQSSGSGSIEADCRVDNIRSNTLSMPIQP
jgi:hypothetical protein